MHRGQHVFTEASGGFYGLAVKQTVFEVLDIPRLLFFIQSFEAAPQVFLSAFFGGVVVKPSASSATRALVFMNHVRDQQFSGGWGIGFSFGLHVCHGLFHHMHTQAQSRFIENRQRAHRHAALHARVFNRSRWNSFAQHGCTLHHKGTKHPAGEKTTRIVHHNRNFPNRLNVVKGLGNGVIVGMFSADDFNQFHFVYGAEKMNTNEPVGCVAGLGQSTDGQGGGVGCKKPARFEQRLSLFCDLGFERAVLKHRFNDQVAVLQVLGVCSGMNQG